MRPKVSCFEPCGSCFFVNVGANLCVRPFHKGRHTGLPLPFRLSREGQQPDVVIQNSSLDCRAEFILSEANVLAMTV